MASMLAMNQPDIHPQLSSGEADIPLTSEMSVPPGIAWGIPIVSTEGGPTITSLDAGEGATTIVEDVSYSPISPILNTGQPIVGTYLGGDTQYNHAKHVGRIQQMGMERGEVWQEEEGETNHETC